MLKYVATILRNFFALNLISKKSLLPSIITTFLRIITIFPIPYFASRIIESLTDPQPLNLPDFFADFLARPELSPYTSVDSFPVFFYITLFFLSSCVHLFFAHLSQSCQTRISDHIHNILQSKVLHKSSNLDNNYRKTLSTATILNAAFSDNTDTQRIPTQFLNILADLLAIIISIILIAIIDLRLGFISASLAIIATILFFHHMNRRRQIDRTVLSHQDDLSYFYTEIIDGKKEVHALNLKRKLKLHLNQQIDSWENSYAKKCHENNLAVGLTPILIGAILIFFYLLITPDIFAGTATLATLVLLLGYYEYIEYYFTSLVENILLLSYSYAAVSRLRELLEYTSRSTTNFGKNNNDYIKGKVEFDHVSFSFDRHPFLKDVTFTAHPNTFTALIGPSGSGKTTLFQLLLRHEKPKSGKILLDDINVNNYTPEVYSTNVSVVTQTPFVFNLTIRENLDLVDPDHKNQIAACRTVGIHDIIMKLPKKYNTVLHEDAKNLSAGEKQLLALARVLLSKSEVLLFDEITAHLDDATAEKIVHILNNLKENHTVIIITHNHALLRHADQVLELSPRGTLRKIK